MLRTVLEQAGLALVSLVRGEIAWSNMANIPQPQVSRMAKTTFVKVPHADGLLIAGGGAAVYEIVEALDMALRKPVVAHTFAAAWHALRMARGRQPIEGSGRVLTTF
jgi:maleate cis-trans isomerase